MSIIKRNLIPILAVLVFCPLLSAELTVEGDTKVKRDKLVRLTAKGADAKAGIFWDVSEEDKCDIEELKDGRIIFSAPPGTYKVKCRSVIQDKDGKTQVETARVTVTVTEATPAPPTPTPPNPDPNPPGPGPDPGPTPGPAPIKLDGLRVMIIEETKDRQKLPLAQWNIIFDKKIRDYLNSKCPKEGGTRNWPEWRIWDKDVDASKEANHWQQALKIGKESKGFTTPWIVISNGKTGYSGPLPKDVDSTLTLMKKYGGE